MPVAPRTINNKQSFSANKQLTINNATNGFTLVELLVVIGVLGVVTGSALLFLTSILKGSNQARIVADVKQNGQIVLDSIDRQIRNAQEIRVITPPAGSDSAIELVLSGGNLYLACFNPVASPAQNGWIGTAGSSGGPYNSLTNKDEVDGINVICDWDAVSPGVDSFAVFGSAADPYPQIVKVNFKVKQPVDAPTRADFEVSEQLFSTTISLRKYSF